MTCKFVLKCSIRENWLVDNNELIKTVAEIFSVKIVFVFSLNTLNRLNAVIVCELNIFLEIHLLFVSSNVFELLNWCFDKNHCKLMLAEFVFVPSFP